MVECKTLYAVNVKLNSKNSVAFVQSVIEALIQFKDKIKTITFDNGLEFSVHETLSQMLDADVYFANPYCSWEHGTNENINGFIRRYFPKATDFNNDTEGHVAVVMDKLNNRPPATRGGKN